MYAFAQRADTRVFDEPLYAAYLAAHPEQQRPYREELLRTGEKDAGAVVARIILGPAEPERPVRFFKNIATQFMPTLDRAFLREADHFILVRHPYRVIASYYKALGTAAVHDTGLPRMLELCNELDKIKYDALVLDNSDILGDPASSLQRICSRFGLDYTPRMLTWKTGGIPEDGIWASCWYDNTHRVSCCLALVFTSGGRR